GLPHLPGRKPFGGHIMSQDFVEAALMRRAGWEVRMAPLLGGSYEETPPTLSDLIARDRRWCQGNLQHLMVLPSRGLHWISRLHLLRGVSSYLTAPIWLALLVMGVILALRPDLGVAGWSHARGDGAVAHADSGAVLGIFAISMGFLLAPKLMAFAAMLADPDERRAFGGARRAFGGLMLEMALSTLIAPILMLNQVRALASILAGRDSGWPAQSRDEGRVSLAEAARRHLGDTLAGLALAAAALWAAPDLLLWMSPVVAGLIGAIPVAMLSARRDLGLKARRAGLLLIPEETSPPPVIVHLNALLTRPPEPTPHATPRRAPVAAEPLFS
ncbi:MAG: glucans biosynthesis glucosyltransferase MdoH, partial [Caulobacteraceae bacterium]|nr:glucans biosynthesis glucosyltransferase MdoH [Caulobacteraceae bacterium]